MITKETQAKIDHCIEMAKDIRAKYTGVDIISFKMFNVNYEDIRKLDPLPQKFPDDSIVGLAGYETTGDDNIWLYSGGEQI